MTIGLTPNPTLPNLNDPATFNDRAQALFLWLTATLIPEIEALDANDWFSAQSTFDDATVGKVLKVGAFGWGNSSAQGVFSGSALDEITVTGFHRYASASHSDAPSIVGIVLHLNRLPSSDSGGTMQIAFGSAGDIFYRYLTAVSPVTYSSWHRVYNASNILGTVTQSGGVPTGKLFEKSSNANGYYQRMADGTQMCWHRFTTDGVGAYTWTFPAAFLDTNYALQATHDTSTGGTGFRDVKANNGTTTTGSILTLNDSAGYVAADVSVLAIGRWF